MRVGFIGLGNMGLNMANNLLAGGINLTVNNRSQGKVDEIVSRGALRAATPAELTGMTDVVLACLPNVQTSRDVLLGPDGVIAHASKGQIIADHSTVDLATSRACSDAAAEKGAFFLDAPISGGPTGAEEGSLSIMVGGDDAAFARAKPIFETMGSTVQKMGSSGAGTGMKLVNQLLVSVNVCAAAEAFHLANAAGLDIDLATKVLAVSWGQSRMAERSAPITAAQDFQNSGAPVRNLVKDIGIITALSDDLGLFLPLSKAAELLIDQANRFDPEYDIAGVIKMLELRSPS